MGGSSWGSRGAGERPGRATRRAALDENDLGEIVWESFSSSASRIVCTNSPERLIES